MPDLELELIEPRAENGLTDEEREFLDAFEVMTPLLIEAMYFASTQGEMTDANGDTLSPASEHGKITKAMGRVIGHRFEGGIDADAKTEHHNRVCGCCIAPAKSNDYKYMKVTLGNLAEALPQMERKGAITEVARTTVENAAKLYLTVYMPAVAEAIKQSADEPTPVDVE